MTSQTDLLTLNSRFSHVTESRIFKNPYLRRKVDCSFRSSLLKNHFRHLKLYSSPQSWLARNHCHMSAFWKTKCWSSHFWEGQPFRFCCKKVHRQWRLESTKTGITTEFKIWPTQKPKIWSFFYEKKLYKKIIWFKR